MPRPAHHADATKTLFQNPWQIPDEPDDNTLASSEPQEQQTSWLGSLTGGLPTLSSLLANIPIERAQDFSSHGISPTKVVKPDFEKYSENKKTLKATWLGHASYLVELPVLEDSEKPIRVLFDPMFSDRAGPSSWTGIRRSLPPPCSIEDLPEFQFVLISHNHYDHLDLLSIEEIAYTRGEDLAFFVPLGIGKWLVSLGISTERVYELDWWDEIKFDRPLAHTNSNTNSNSASDVSLPLSSLRFVCVPAQHTSGRTILDRCTTLWCGWIVKEESDRFSARIYHAGDTGYMGTNGACPAFREIGDRHGPIDLAMLPVWRGGTLSFISQLGLRLTHHPLISAMHASPSNAVAIHKDVRSRHSLAMHFATFAGSEVEALEPLVELRRAREEMEISDWWEDGGIGAIDVGQTVEVPISENSIDSQLDIDSRSDRD